MRKNPLQTLEDTPGLKKCLQVEGRCDAPAGCVAPCGEACYLAWMQKRSQEAGSGFVTHDVLSASHYSSDSHFSMLFSLDVLLLSDSHFNKFKCKALGPNPLVPFPRGKGKIPNI
jgi:hypothetical protein